MKTAVPSSIILFRALVLLSLWVFCMSQSSAVEVVPNPTPSADAYSDLCSNHWVSLPRRLWITIELVREDRDHAWSEVQIRSLDTRRVLRVVKVPGAVQVVCETPGSKALMIAGASVNKWFFEPFVWFLDPESGEVVSRHTGGERVSSGKLVENRFWVWKGEEDEFVVDVAHPMTPTSRRSSRNQSVQNPAKNLSLPNWLDEPSFTSGNMTAGSRGKVPGLWRNDTWERIDEFPPQLFRTLLDIARMPGALFDPLGRHGLDVENLLPRDLGLAAATTEVKVLEVNGAQHSFSSTKFGVKKLPAEWGCLVGCSHDQERVFYKVSKAEPDFDFEVREWNLASGTTSSVMKFATMGHSPQFEYLDSGFGETVCARVYGPSAGAYGFGLATRQDRGKGWEVAAQAMDELNHPLNNLCGACYAKTPSGQVVLVKCFTSKISTHNPQTGSQLAEVAATKQWWVNFSLQSRYVLPDKGRLVIPFRNGGSQIFDLGENGVIKAAAQMWVGPGDTWLMLLPDGRYAASPHGWPPVHFREGDRIFPVEDYDLAMNQPDVVAQALGFPGEVVSELAGLRAKRLQRAGDAASAAEGTGGELVLNPPPPLTFDEDYLTLHGEIVAGKQGVRALEVHVNDVPVSGWQAAEGGLTAGVRREIDIRVPLSAGANKVQLALKDDSGRLSGRKTFLVHRSSANVKAARYVLAIGVSEYQDAEVQDLVYAGKDAQEIATALTQVSGRFQKSEILVLKDAEADHDHILAAGSFLQKSRPGDEVIVFVAGHGVITPEGDYAFCPADYRVSDGGQALRFRELEGLLAQAGALTRLLLIDTCHSGEVDEDYVRHAKASHAKAGARGVVMRSVPTTGSAGSQGHQKMDQRAGDLFVDLRRTVGATVLSGASSFEFALEDDHHKNGIFTFAIKEALSGAGKDEDEVMTASDLVKIVARRVAKLTGDVQNPEARFINMATDFNVVDARLKDVSEKPEAVVQRLAEWTSGSEDLERLPSLFTAEVDYFGKKFSPAQVMNEELRSAQQFTMMRYTPSGFVAKTLADGAVSLTYDLHFTVQKELPPQQALELTQKRNSQWKRSFESFSGAPPNLRVKSVFVSREARMKVLATVVQNGTEWRIRSLKVISP